MSLFHSLLSGKQFPNYNSLSNIELLVDFTGLIVGTTNTYGTVDGSGNITNLKSLAPGPTGRDFPSNGTAPTLSGGSGVFGGSGRLRHATAATWKFMHYNATRANLKHTVHAVVKFGTDINPSNPYGYLGNTGTSGGNKGFHAFYADSNTTNNNALVTTVANTSGSAPVTLQSDCMIPNSFFVITIVTNLGEATAADRQKIYINGTRILNAGVTDTGGALQNTDPTYALEIGGCGNATVSLVGSIRELLIQSAVETDVVRSAFIAGLISKHSVRTSIGGGTLNVFNPVNVYSDGRYPITNTLLRSITNPNVIVSCYSDWTLGHTWRTTNVMSTRKSTDGGLTWGARTVIYSDVLFGVIESGGGVDPDTGLFHMFFTVHSGSGTTIDTGFKFLHITSSDDGDTWSSPEDLASLIPATDLAWTYGGMIKNEGVLMKPYYTIDAPGDINPNSVRLLRKDGSNPWTSVLVQANTTEYRNESEVIALSSTYVMYIARDDVSFEYRQFMSSDNGLNWSDQGDLSFGYAFSFASPLRLKKIQIAGVDVIVAYVADRANRRIQAIYGKASDLIASGVSGWNLSTKLTIRQFNTSPAQQPEYGDFSHDPSGMGGIMSFALDDGSGGASITSVIHTGTIPSWQYDFVKTTLGL